MEKIRYAKDYAVTLRSALERRIAIRTNSFEEFISTLEREKSQSVRAGVRSFSDSGSAGISGSFGSSGMTYVGVGFETRFESDTEKGRKIVHREYYGYVPVNRHDLSESEVINRVLVSAERRLLEIRGLLPGVTTELYGPEGLFDEERRAELADTSVDEVASLRPVPDYLSVFNKEAYNRLNLS